MDEEGRRLAAMSDAEWDRYVAALVRSAEDDRRRESRTRLSRQGLIALAGVVAVIAAAVTALLLRQGSGGSDPVAEPTRYTPGPPFAGTPAAQWAGAPLALRMPAAHAVGPYSAKEVAGALKRARRYLLTARTDDGVLARHDLTPLHRLTTGKVPNTRESLYGAALAAGNALAAPVREQGQVTVSYTPSDGKYAPHLTVAGNLVWAYALRARYSVDPGSDGVVVVHDQIRLGFYLDPDYDGPRAKVVPQQDESLTTDGDCGFAHDGLIGLPRTDDPRRVPGGDDHGKYDVDASVRSSAGCR